MREFRPQLVAIRDDRVAELKELLKGAPVQPEIVVGAAGIVEVAAHRDADSVVTGQLPGASWDATNIQPTLPDAPHASVVPLYSSC